MKKILFYLYSIFSLAIPFFIGIHIVRQNDFLLKALGILFLVYFVSTALGIFQQRRNMAMIVNRKIAHLYSALAVVTFGISLLQGQLLVKGSLTDFLIFVSFSIFAVIAGGIYFLISISFARK